MRYNNNYYIIIIILRVHVTVLNFNMLEYLI